MDHTVPKVVSRLRHYIKLLCHRQKRAQIPHEDWYKKGKWKRYAEIKQQYCRDNFNPGEEIRIQEYLDWYKKGKWKRHAEIKQQYCRDNFNPGEEIRIQEYLYAYISWREKQVVAQLRTSSHRPRTETRRWEVPKEDCEERK
jgi:mRNA-degrading endonuclease HigB of HigAB toxin-antitoxin module